MEAPSDYTKYRLLEILPGLVVWSCLLGAILFSFIAPLWVVYAIILFDLYWLVRVCYFVFYMFYARRCYLAAIRRDWWMELSTDQPRISELYHLIFLPTYREPLSVVEGTLRRLSEVAYDTKRFIVVLAGEERDKENFTNICKTVIDHYRPYFKDIIVTIHPKDLPEEIPGKGSNLNYSGYRVKDYIDTAQIPYRNIIVSTFDIDTIVHQQYFACLTTMYLKHPHPERSSYQPAVLYNNNLWESPAIVRIAAFGTTFWLMTELARPERLFTFSSHSMSWQALVDVDFWEKRIVSEDSRIFIQCLLRYDGDYMTTPMYIPVSMDMVSGASYLKSLKALYLQQRRWAWGIENLPYMIWNFRAHPHMAFRKKIYYIWNLAEGMFSWAAVPLLIFILGRLPLWVAPDALQQQALFQNAPFVLERLLQFSMIGIFVSAIFSLGLMPPRPAYVHRYAYVTMLLQWALLPLTLVLFGSFAAIDAQTRLMLGRYLGFNVTEKMRQTMES